MRVIVVHGHLNTPRYIHIQPALCISSSGNNSNRHPHARIQEVSSGGGQVFFFVFNLIYTFTERVQWFVLRKTILFKFPVGVQHFWGGGSNFF